MLTTIVKQVIILVLHLAVQNDFLIFCDRQMYKINHNLRIKIE